MSTLRTALAVLVLCGAALAGSIVYVNEGRLWTIEPDGTRMHTLAIDSAPPEPVLPTWSPDGRQIAFGWLEQLPLTDTTDMGGLPGWILCFYVCGADSAGACRELYRAGMTEDGWGVELGRVEWSQDGREVGFVVYSDELYTTQRTYVVRLADDSVRVNEGVDFGAEFIPARPGLSDSLPDGRKLRSRNVRGLDELFVVASKNPKGRQVTHSSAVRDTSVVSEWGSADNYGVWSPDGKRILFRPLTVAADFMHGPLLSVNPDGRNQRLLADDGGILGEFPRAWSPDYRRMAFDVSDSIFVTDFKSDRRFLCVGTQPDWNRAKR
jgi:Tol biopolymer transport system component